MIINVCQKNELFLNGTKIAKIKIKHVFKMDLKYYYKNYYSNQVAYFLVHSLAFYSNFFLSFL